MTEPVEVKVEGVTYKVHSDGDVFRVNPGILGSSTRLVGKIPPSTPLNELEKKIRVLPNR